MANKTQGLERYILVSYYGDGNSGGNSNGFLANLATNPWQTEQYKPGPSAEGQSRTPMEVERDMKRREEIYLKTGVDIGSGAQLGSWGDQSWIPPVTQWETAENFGIPGKPNDITLARVEMPGIITRYRGPHTHAIRGETYQHDHWETYAPFAKDSDTKKGNNCSGTNGFDHNISLKGMMVGSVNHRDLETEGLHVMPTLPKWDIRSHYKNYVDKDMFNLSAEVYNKGDKNK